VSKSKTKLHELTEFGQSAWLDYIDRSLLDSGKLRKLIDQGLRGMTSNPSIFNQAISKSADYDKKIIQLKEDGKTTFEIYDELTVQDIQDACDIFKPVYDQTEGLDGYVSLEINPELANDTNASIQEGKRLFIKVNRPNVMIKVPATDAGFPVVEDLIAGGVNVNVTLIFSFDQYVQTVDAYFRGLERAIKKGIDVSRVRSVASVFVSRIDTAIDKLIDEECEDADEVTVSKLKSLKGKAAVANCRIIFEKSKELFSGMRFTALFDEKANVQRVLWGSTSTKNRDYPDVKYVEELITKPTVNTIPESTLHAFMDHGMVKDAFANDPKEARDVITVLRDMDIEIDDVCLLLLDDGVVAFEDAFQSLLNSIETKARQLCAH
jgi:transaldolase